MNRTLKFYYGILIVGISLFVYSCTSSPGSWSQFRGPEGNMIVPGTNLPTEWNDSLNVSWKTDLTGDGWSSPIVFGDKIFITSAFLEKAAPASAKPAPPPPQVPKNVGRRVPQLPCQRLWPASASPFQQWH